MAKEKKKNFNNVQVLQSIVNKSLIVLSIPSKTDDAEFFRGVIIACEDSISGNAPLQMSHHYRKDKFELYEGGDLVLKF